MSFELHVIRNDLPNASSKAKAAIGRGFERTRPTVDSNIKGRTPVRTGFLQGRNTTTIEDSGGRPTLVARNDAYYAWYRHEGTRFMSGVPFLREGLEASVSDLEANVESELRAEFT